MVFYRACSLPIENTTRWKLQYLKWYRMFCWRLTGEMSRFLGLTDLLAALDMVDLEILIHRLQSSFRISEKALSQILSFILQRTQTVSCNGKQSTKSAVVCGVPQGSVRVPVLFLLYTADVIRIARDLGINPYSYAARHPAFHPHTSCVMCCTNSSYDSVN